MTTTTDLSEFNSGNRLDLIELLRAWDRQGLPEDFYDDEVRPMLNKNSGYVFLTNSDYQVAMMNGDKLESWYTCSNCGHEGFEEDCSLEEDGCNECCGNYDEDDSLPPFRSFQDFRNYISDQPLSCPELYDKNYVEMVAMELVELCMNKGFEYGRYIPKITDEEFWDCFKCAELEKEGE